MKFFRWVGSKMGLFKKNDGQISKTSVAATGGGLVTAAMVSAAIFLSQTTGIGSPMTEKFEGTVLAVYKDVVGIDTWCTGETQIGRLPEGETYSAEYCQTLWSARYPQYAAQLFSCYDDKAKRYVTPAMHAAFTDVYYNTGAKCNTGMVRNLKRGNPVEACNYILKYKRAGGKDCSKRDSGCYGVYARRLEFHPLCLEDAVKIPPGGLG